MFSVLLLENLQSFNGWHTDWTIVCLNSTRKIKSTHTTNNNIIKNVKSKLEIGNNTKENYLLEPEGLQENTQKKTTILTVRVNIDIHIK